jgi:hypothetical protein
MIPVLAVGSVCRLIPSAASNTIEDIPGSAMVKYKESERWAHLIGAVLVCAMLAGGG